MKITLIWSSANTDGLTAKVKNSIVKGIEKNCKISEFYLNKMNLHHCIACKNGFGLCKEEGKCVLYDDFEKIYQSLCECDKIIFVTAVYWHDVTEQMKVILDRLRRIEASHNHYLKEKDAIIVSVAGGSGKGVTECLVKLEETLSHMEINCVERIGITRRNAESRMSILKGLEI